MPVSIRTNSAQSNCQRSFILRRCRVTLQIVEPTGEYVHAAAQLDLTHGKAPVRRVLIPKTSKYGKYRQSSDLSKRVHSCPVWHSPDCFFRVTERMVRRRTLDAASAWP